MKLEILILACAVLLPLASAEEACPSYLDCPDGYYLNQTSCFCVECEGDECLDTDGAAGEDGVDEGTGTGFGGSGGAAETTSGFLNIIYSFEGNMFVWILLFIIFLIAIGVLIKFASALTT